MALPDDPKRKIAQMFHALWFACPIRTPHLFLLLLCSTIWPTKSTNAVTLIAAVNESSEIFDYEPAELTSLTRQRGSVELDDGIAVPNVDLRNNYNENNDDNHHDDVFDDVKDYMNDFTLPETAAAAPLLKDVFDQQPIGNEDDAISSNGRELRDRRTDINDRQAADVVLRNEPQSEFNVGTEKDASKSFDTSRLCKNFNERIETKANGREYQQRCNEGVAVVYEYQNSEGIINEQEEKKKINLMQENRRNYDELLLKTDKDEHRVPIKPIIPATTAAILSRFLNERSTMNKHTNEARKDYNEFTSSGRPEAAQNDFMASRYQNLNKNQAAQKNEQNYDTSMTANNSQLSNQKIELVATTARSSLELPDTESYTESYISQQLQQRGQEEQQFKRDDKIVEIRDIMKNPTHELLFEKYKAQRRNNQRTGHKIHKKKYKDYLKYGMPLTTTTTAAMKTDETIKKFNRNNKNDEVNYSRQNLINSTNNISQTNIKHARQQQPSTRLHKYVKLTQAKQQQQQQQQQQEQQQSGELTAPIFALRFNEYTTKPFYQGQINYYKDTDERDDDDDDDDDELVDDNWLKDLNGMRDEIKKNTHEEHHHRNKKQNRFAGRHRLLTKNNRRQNHQHHHHHHYHHQLHQHQRNYNRRREEYNKDKAYQSYGVAMTEKEERITQTSTPPLLTPTSTSTQRQPLRELGHQITEMKELERFYAKWPHLAQVQAYERSMRPPTNAGTDDEYDEDYESAAELEEAQNDNNEDADLPPYIKKYNRRNKQLLNLLEGTLPPPPPPTMRTPAVQAKWSNSLLQPGPHESSNGGLVIRAYNEKDKRPHHHNQNASQRRLASASSKRFDSLFAQQSHTTEPFDYAFAKPAGDETYNHLPDEYVDASNEWPANGSPHENGDDDDAAFWQKTSPPYGSEINLSKQRNANAEQRNASREATNGIIRKAALYKLPSIGGSFGGSFVGLPRSRSAQFVSNVAGRGNSYVHVGGLSSETTLRRSSTSTALENRHNSMLEQAPKTQQRFAEINRSANQLTRRDHRATTTTTQTPNSLNSFAYHRVEAPAPLLRTVGVTERKQHLPFVAITDRRLESFKKTLTSSHKDFKNNNLSMP